MMPGTWRRGKRSMDQTGARNQIPSLLPLSTSRNSLTHAVSCWYCDYKITSLNEPLFYFGRRHSRILRVWFSIGIGFCIAALAVVTTVLFLELAIALYLLSNNNELHDLPLSSSSLFGFSPLLFSNSFAPADAGCVIISTLISVAFHEFGHAVAAASEGIKLEYVAVFIALLIPGALVAFSDDLLQDSSRFTTLRIYCAGIWHNAVLSGACGLILFFLPFILSLLYIQGENPMVLDVPSTSPLYGYLSRGDVIMSLDGMSVRSVKDWIKLSGEINELTFHKGTLSKLGDDNRMSKSRKGYCVPNYMLKESNKVQFTHYQSTCSGGLASFTTIPCVSAAALIDDDVEDSHPNYGERIHCLNVIDVIKLNKCFNGLDEAIINGSTCTCSQDETCSSPVQVPGLVWVDITYLNPQSLECLHYGVLPTSNCSASFIFVGDVISMARSIQLTTFQPRWDIHFAPYLPNSLERILLCLFHISLTLAVLNSLPVYYLDGESILEVILFHFTSMSSRHKGKVLQSFLIGGTLVSILFLLRAFFHLFVSYSHNNIFSNLV